jgi:competence protein ComEA
MTTTPDPTTVEGAFTRTLRAHRTVPKPFGLGARTRALAARLRAACNTSAWATLAGRGLILITGLFVLAWIGRTATAAPEPPVPREAAVAVDAGVSVLVATSGALPQSAPASLSAPAPAPPAAAPPATATSTAARARATADDPVYVNHAGVEELRRLPGVGPKRAEAIVALRQRMGRFQRVEDLLRVKGIGRTTLRKWRPLVRLDTPDGGAP